MVTTTLGVLFSIPAIVVVVKPSSVKVQKFLAIMVQEMKDEDGTKNQQKPSNQVSIDN